MNINHLLKPNKIAIIGASEKNGFGGDTCRNAIAYMAKEDYYFINPKRDEVLGVQTYSSLSQLPEKVDLAVLCTPQSTIEPLLRELASCGVGAAVVYASGYGEVGTPEGKAAEKALQDLAKELDICVMGPNCAGFVNYIQNKHAFAFISDPRERKGRIGVVSQSGQLVLSMMDKPNARFSYLISAGNSCSTTMEDYFDFLVDDEDTKVVAMYLEGIKNPAKFVKSLEKAARLKKPVVILKSGRSNKGQLLAASHTGSLSGSDKTYDALFKKFGVIRVNDLEELLTTAQALATLNDLPKGKGVGVLSLSGGETGICADLGELHGLNYPDFSQTTLTKLTELLPSYATPNNPLDATATLSYDTMLFAETLKTIMQDISIDVVVVGYTLLQEVADPAIEYMSAAMEMVSQESWAKPMVMIPFTENTRNAHYVDKLSSCGVPVLPTSIYGFKIMHYLLDFAMYEFSEHDFRLALPKSKIGEESQALTESESKSLVAAYGVPVGKTDIAHSVGEAKEIFNRFGGKPVVAKIDSPDIMHKSDAGCVKLSLKSELDVAQAYQSILDNALAYNAKASITGVQICEMAPQGVEMIVGVHNDASFGPVVLCGMGGVFVEVFKDVALALAPLSIAEAYAMIDKLKSKKILSGYRGQQACDIEALAKLLVNVGNMAVAHIDDMKELDINPVMLYEEGLCAVDALYVKYQTDGSI